MRLITGSLFPWCDVTETSPYCESLMVLHAAKISCLLPLLCRSWAPQEPGAVQGRFLLSPPAALQLPLLRREHVSEEPGLQLPAGQVPRRWHGLPWHSLAWHGLVRAGQALSAGCERMSERHAERQRLVLTAVPREHLTMHGPM